MSYVTMIYSVLKLLVLSAPKPSEDKWEHFPKTISIDLSDSLQNLVNIQSMLMNKQRKRNYSDLTREEMVLAFGRNYLTMLEYRSPQHATPAVV